METHAGYVKLFTSRILRLSSLSKQVPRPEVKSRIAPLYSASREMLRNAKEAQALTDIFAALNPTNRPTAVLLIMSDRLEDILVSIPERLKECAEAEDHEGDATTAEAQNLRNDIKQFSDALRTTISMLRSPIVLE